MNEWGARGEGEIESLFPFYFGCAPASANTMCENEHTRVTPFQADAKA